MKEKNWFLFDGLVVVLFCSLRLNLREFHYYKNKSHNIRKKSILNVCSKEIFNNKRQNILLFFDMVDRFPESIIHHCLLIHIAWYFWWSTSLSVPFNWFHQLNFNIKKTDNNSIKIPKTIITNKNIHCMHLDNMKHLLYLLVIGRLLLLWWVNI